MSELPAELLALDIAVVHRGRTWRFIRQVRGRALGLYGPSGCGKSTLIRAMAGAQASTGVMCWGGRDLRRLGVGWVPQEYALFPHLSVRENLGYAGPVLPETVDALGLTPLLDRTPRFLSGGEQQRVALGRAICRRPEVLLLDEPFAALDRVLKRRVREHVAGWAAQAGAYVVVVSHDPEDFGVFGAEVWEV